MAAESQVFTFVRVTVNAPLVRASPVRITPVLVYKFSYCGSVNAALD